MNIDTEPKINSYITIQHIVVKDALIRITDDPLNGLPMCLKISDFYANIYEAALLSYINIQDIKPLLTKINELVIDSVMNNKPLSGIIIL